MHENIPPRLSHHHLSSFVSMKALLWKLQYPRQVTSRVVKRLNTRPPTHPLARVCSCVCVTPDCHCAAIFFCCYRVLAPHKVSKMENPSPALNGPLCSNSRELRGTQPPTHSLTHPPHPPRLLCTHLLYVLCEIT